MSKKPDLVVWSEENGYDAKNKSYPTSVNAPKFELPNVGLVTQEASKKMMDVFEREKKEIAERIERLYREYADSVRVWESKISFEPVVGKEYHLYIFNGKDTLSLISPNEWDKKEYYVGTFTLNSDRKWIRTNTKE
jgi:hypothetical protein